jgi:hypothetical protein
MKQCPACHRTYTDDAQMFCLEDGVQLVPASHGGSTAPSSFDPNATLAYNPGRETKPPPENFYPPMPSAPTHAFPTWTPTPQLPVVPPERKSSNRAWIIGAIAAVVILAAGIVALIIIIGKNTSDDSNKNSNNAVASNTNTTNTTNRNPGNTNNANRGTVPTTSSVLKDDFSTENWPTGEKAFGSFYEDGEYHMKGKPKLYVYMFPLSKASSNVTDYTTKDATVKVTARSVGGQSPEYGYGMIAHGKVNSKGNLEGYGFLIYTGSTPMYTITRFVDGVPNTMVNWTQSSVIRGGTNSNQIEVRSSGSQLSMYVNGQFLKSITDTANYTDGYVGLYTSETNEIAFDDMEIDRGRMK